jgi:hypothetical protein
VGPQTFTPYIYVAELANAAGATQSKAVSVTVR